MELPPPPPRTYTFAKISQKFLQNRGFCLKFLHFAPPHFGPCPPTCRQVPTALIIETSSKVVLILKFKYVSIPLVDTYDMMRTHHRQTKMTRQKTVKTALYLQKLSAAAGFF